MTDRDIITEFERIEAAANKTARGADHQQILRIVAEKAERPIEDVRRLILDNTFTKAN